MPLIIFHLNCILLLLMKMNKIFFYFIHEKLEQRVAKIFHCRDQGGKQVDATGLEKK